MNMLDTKKGTGATAPSAPLSIRSDRFIYPLPPEYRKPNQFWVRGRVIKFLGGRALVLDRLIEAGPAGIDRATTLQWVANLADTIGALRAAGVAITTRKGQAANYALACVVLKIGGDK